jgi:putative transposase
LVSGQWSVVSSPLVSFPRFAWERASGRFAAHVDCAAALLLTSGGDHATAMTRSRYRIYDGDCPHFLTCTIVGWLPVFTRVESVEIVMNCWKYLQDRQRLTVFGYVILENHLHLIVSSPRLAREIAIFKSYTARQILDLLEARSASVLLGQLRHEKARHKIDREYQLWQEGSHPQEIQGDAMMWQKLEYMHNNPVERGYVDDPLHWRYSSARNYAGQAGLFPVRTDWQ